VRATLFSANGLSSTLHAFSLGGFALGVKQSPGLIPFVLAVIRAVEINPEAGN
jgi:hypothetical protein